MRGSGAASGWAAEAVAVAHAQLEFSRWGWLFATSAVDYGSIDAQVEAVDGGLMSGRRVGLVIKSGGAWFSDPVPEGWLYRGRNAELLYWMGHSLPIVLLFYNPDTAITYWVHVTQDNAQIDRTGWKILIPSSQVLDPQALPAFWALADPAGWAASRDAEERWTDASQALAHSLALAAESVGQPAADQFHSWVGTLVDRFQHAVENNGLWRALWDDREATPRGEKIVQVIAGATWSGLCEAADVDMSREADAGRGAVDFKFSAGWHRRALIEFKLLSSSHLIQGIQAQLPQYLASEQISSGYYVCVGFTDDDMRPEHLDRIRRACMDYQARTRLIVTPRFIDARPKPPASRLPREAG